MLWIFLGIFWRELGYFLLQHLVTLEGRRSDVWLVQLCMKKTKKQQLAEPTERMICRIILIVIKCFVNGHLDK